MPYVLLVVEPVGQRDTRSESEGRALYERMLRFSEDLKSRGLLTLTQSLKSQAAAVRLTRQGNRVAMVDGPFAEAKEMIGGFFLLTCESREQALAIARECPAAEWATIEVRELGPCYQ
ncbi:MAG TPA: YciI family protein [Steroidobacteraceae bacterium]|nr:YciI family protein [Steroidobacteraceae bacterium]